MNKQSYQWFDSSPVPAEHVELARELARTNFESRIFTFARTDSRSFEPLVTCDPNGRDWRVGRFIGDLYIGNTHIRIQPRMGMNTVYSWLEHEPSRLFTSATPSGAKWDDKQLILEILFHIFKAQLAAASVHGVPRHEKTETIISQRLQGAINVRATARQYNFSRHRLASTKRFRSRDTPISRIILAAHRIFHQRLQNFELPAHLTDVVNELATESYADFSVSTSQIMRTKLTPATFAFQPFALFCHRIVKQFSLTPDPEAQKSENSVLLDVSELFEHHVLRCLRVAFPNYKVIDGNERNNNGLTSGRFLLSAEGKQFNALYPDFLIMEPNSGQIRMVVDAKYKRNYANAREPIREDAFQMTAYLDHFGRGNPTPGALISPVNDGENSQGKNYSLTSNKSIIVGSIRPEISHGVQDIYKLLCQELR